MGEGKLEGTYQQESDHLYYAIGDARRPTKPTGSFGPKKSKEIR